MIMPKKSKNVKNAAAKKNAPLILEATLESGARLTMYGEDHQQIDNAFYENLQVPPSTAILVEHSTNDCNVTANTEHLFQAHAKGTEWVFYTQKKAGNPNVVCFDTRAEHGYLNAFQEQELAQVAQRLPLGVPADIRFFMDHCLQTMGVFAQQRVWFDGRLPGYFERSYVMLESQLRAAMALLKWRKVHGANSTVLGGIPLAQLLPGVAATLVANLRRVASVSVDINLVRVIEDLTRRRGAGNILVFAGKNHVVRMMQMLELPKVKITAALAEQASIEVDGDMETDQQILTALT